MKTIFKIVFSIRVVKDIFVIFEITVVALICKFFLTFGESSVCRKQYNGRGFAY